LPGSTLQSIFFAQSKMDARVKPAHDGQNERAIA
jgi:hypothetical protein